MLRRMDVKQKLTGVNAKALPITLTTDCGLSDLSSTQCVVVEQRCRNSNIGHARRTRRSDYVVYFSCLVFAKCECRMQINSFNFWSWISAISTESLENGEKDFELVWLQEGDSLNIRCEHFLLLTFCHVFFEGQTVFVWLIKMRVIC